MPAASLWRPIFRGALILWLLLIVLFCTVWWNRAHTLGPREFQIVMRRESWTLNTLLLFPFGVLIPLWAVSRRRR